MEYGSVEIASARSKRSVLTYTGKVLDLANPRPVDLCILDVGEGLSTLVRFAGQIAVKYTVAQHCAAGVRGVLDNWKYGFHDPKLVRALRSMLLHETGEAFLRDVPTPAKLMMPDYVRVEAGLLRAAGVAFRADLDPLPPIVKAVDASLCGYEARLFHPDVPADLLDIMFPPVLERIDPAIPSQAWGPRQARDVFMRLWSVLEEHPDPIGHLMEEFTWS